MSDLFGLISKKLCYGVHIYIFVEFLVHHANGCGAAAGEAFNELDAVITIGTDRDGIVHSLAMTFALNSSRGAQAFHYLKAASHRAAKRPADTDVRLPRRFLTKHR